MVVARKFRRLVDPFVHLDPLRVMNRDGCNISGLAHVLFIDSLDRTLVILHNSPPKAQVVLYFDHDQVLMRVNLQGDILLATFSLFA